MRSVAWTDVLQGLTMFAVLVIGVIVVARVSGGAAASYTRLSQDAPELFARPGAGAGLLLGVWASYMLLWLLADPMFPQLFQRFYAASGERSIVRTMVLYPVLTTVLFFFPVAIGVLGRLHVPGLVGKESDTVLPRLMERFGGDWLAALASAGLIAGIMSTMDSQLLTLGSIVQRDLLGIRESAKGEGLGAPGGRPKATLGITRLALALLAVAGFLLALRPPATILAIATETFAGLAVLMPAVFAALYWDRATPTGALLSIALGEAVVVLHHFGVLPRAGLLPAIPAVAVAAAALVATGLATRRPIEPRPSSWKELTTWGVSRKGKVGWTVVFLAFLGLSIDWWRFDGSFRLVAGIPDWLFYFAALGVLLSLAFWLFGRGVLKGGGSARPVSSVRE
jgi:SSS family solute:Na+ symporter